MEDFNSCDCRCYYGRSDRDGFMPDVTIELVSQIVNGYKDIGADRITF